ncbi:hypothetical protein MUK42_07877 [Musa troglodytarum]|uniref:Uncharacterized protein n=1 Tax=Musa troglodytarum TaxID=320322 RepID=A0A9E7FW16_9LILI|nr:hypothetical protein MUK42_07877 [Musa troglodytarum]
MHSVVLRYNYYHRKQFPELKFLAFEPFCKMASIANPSLLISLLIRQKMFLLIHCYRMLSDVCLQGPLIRTDQPSEVTSVVKYYHLLPYYDILSDWISRETHYHGFLPSLRHLAVVDKDNWSWTNHGLKEMYNVMQQSTLRNVLVSNGHPFTSNDSYGGQHMVLVNQLHSETDMMIIVELDDLCYELGWTLPQYSVLPSILDGRVEDVNFYSGMFQATVTLKGLNFECTVNGDMKSSRRAARSSAAATHMLSKLLSMARSQAQARV